MTDFAARLQALREASLLRERRLLESRPGAASRIDGRDVLNFSSNDYLGLAGDPRIAEAMARAAGEVGAGSAASHLLAGHHALHHRLEEALAEFVQRPRALFFSTGYMANLGVVAALAGRGDTLVLDRLAHASLIDGARLSGARLMRFRHNDPEHLAQCLARGPAPALIATESVFSMDGDVAPLHDLARLARSADAMLVVDEAHALGVLGEGRGLVAQARLGTDDVPFVVGTLGKAVGVFGAFVAGEVDAIEYLLQKARPYIYTTATPPAVAAACLCSLEIIQSEPERRQQLRDNQQYFALCAREASLPLEVNDTPIQPLLVGREDTAVALEKALWDAGLLVKAIRPPTVPKGTARLRITLTAAHQRGHIERLVDAIVQARGT